MTFEYIKLTIYPKIGRKVYIEELIYPYLSIMELLSQTGKFAVCGKCLKISSYDFDITNCCPYCGKEFLDKHITDGFTSREARQLAEKIRDSLLTKKLQDD